MTIVKEISVKVNIEKSNTRLNVSYVTISTTSFPEDWRVATTPALSDYLKGFVYSPFLKLVGYTLSA